MHARRSNCLSTTAAGIRLSPLAQVAGVGFALLCLGTAGCSSGSSNAAADAAAGGGNSGGSAGQGVGRDQGGSSFSGGTSGIVGTSGGSSAASSGGSSAAGSRIVTGGSATISSSAGVGGGAPIGGSAGVGGGATAGADAGAGHGGGTTTDAGGVATGAGGATSLGGNSAPGGGTTSAGGVMTSGGSDSGGAKTTGGSPGTAGVTATAGATATGGSTTTGGGTPPGDIAAKAGTPLVAGHSMTRALYSAYNGKLFQVRRASDAKTQDISVTGAGGYVNMDALNTFCSGTTCSVSLLYDQSGNANDLPQATAVNQPTVDYWSTSDGTRLPMAVTVSKQWLRNRTKTTKIPTGSAPQTEYSVFHGSYFNSKCCYDYGNMETTIHDDGAGTMSALYFGSSTDWTKGAGSGPWGMADFENGLFAGSVKDPGGTNSNYPSIAYPGNNLVTVLAKTNGTTSWALKAGNATSGPLSTYWNGALPSGYSPLKQQGGLSLGEGGDGSNLGSGAFSEGVVIAAMTSDATDDLIQSNLTGVYGR